MELKIKWNKTCIDIDGLLVFLPIDIDKYKYLYKDSLREFDVNNTNALADYMYLLEGFADQLHIILILWSIDQGYLGVLKKHIGVGISLKKEIWPLLLKYSSITKFRYFLLFLRYVLSRCTADFC